MEGNGNPWKINQEMLAGLPDELKRSLVEYESQKINMGLMGQIIGEMKEIPILASEIPPENDRNPLIKVEFPEEGGVLTYMEGYDFPYRGFPYFEIVEKIDVIKKIAKASLSGLYHSLKRRRLMLLTLIPAILVFRDLMTAGVYTFYRLIERFKIKKTRMSRCMRALHQAFSDTVSEDTRVQELSDMLRDLICNTLEFDNAYRFRAQDLVEALDRKRLEQSPIQELLRLLTLAQSRETTQEIRDTWKLIKLFVSFYLRFDRKLLKLFQSVLLNLNVEQFKLTPEDTQFCVKRKDYVFGFMN